MTEELRERMYEVSEVFQINGESNPFYTIAFQNGTKWVLENLWHDASEEPELNSTIVIKWASDTHISIAEFNGCVSYSKNRFRVQSDLGYGEISISKWCYLDDILPDSK